MFYYRGISMVDAYFHGISETTLKSYRSSWKTFIYFLVEENYNNSDWKDKNLCQEITPESCSLDMPPFYTTYSLKHAASKN
jgi:hypothetical protein